MKYIKLHTSKKYMSVNAISKLCKWILKPNWLSLKRDEFWVKMQCSPGFSLIWVMQNTNVMGDYNHIKFCRNI